LSEIVAGFGFGASFAPSISTFDRGCRFCGEAERTGCGCFSQGVETVPVKGTAKECDLQPVNAREVRVVQREKCWAWQTHFEEKWLI
jgi:hypothetical protein